MGCCHDDDDDDEDDDDDDDDNDDDDLRFRECRGVIVRRGVSRFH